MRTDALNMEMVKETINILKDPGQLFEIRILKGRQTISGYFTDAEKLEAAFKTVDLTDANVFYTLNYINPDCYAREQHDCFRVAKTTTSDNDILSYQWLLIDLDPERATGISSTNQEVIRAKELAERIVTYLRGKDYPAPIMALSGNGIHLLYRIALKNTPENVALIERSLKALDLLFSNNKIGIDKKVFNPSRISKLYGTMAQKGTHTRDRPHRISRIISRPDTIKQVKKEQLEALAKEYPEEQRQKSGYQQSNGFDLDEWIREHDVKVDSVKTWRDTTRYILVECPFDSNHKAPDATLIKMPGGAICFKCFHNSCSGHDWREFRLKYEPDAYDDKRAEEDARIEAGWKEYKKYNRQRDDIAYAETPAIDAEPVQMFETMAEILTKPKEERICIPTGLKDFDKRVGGLAKGEISLVSGLRGSAKSTWLSQVVLNAIDKDYSVLVYSGELKNYRYINWMLQQAAGKDLVEQSRKYEGLYYCRQDIKPRISEWVGTKFRLYNNDFGSNFKTIAGMLQLVIKEFKSDFVVIDNMSILDLSDISADRRADKWDQQKLFVETLKNLSMICNCHIVFVAHPRKAMGFLRLDDVGGSGSLGNLVDNAFIIHRNNTDFENGYAAYRKKKWGYADCGNIIEVVKERETGMQDVFIPLWYEKESRRLLNNPDERIIYGWDYDGFMSSFMDAPDEDLPWSKKEKSENNGQGKN